MRSNYALYVGNGPELNAATNGTDTELEGIVAEGRTEDVDGDKVWGGRFGVLPMNGLELGVSFATGKAAVTNIVDEAAGTTTAVSNDAARDYEVLGMDLYWRLYGVELRGEYVRTRIGDAPASVAAEGATWKTWYGQAAYRLPSLPVEGVLRYADLDSPHAAEDQSQWVVGVNYLFSPNAMAKVAYEFNSGQAGAASDADSILVQMAYGF